MTASQEIQYSIHPRIGVARVGNSPDEFYLSPESTGGMPIRCDKNGNPLLRKNGSKKYVKKFKDDIGRIKRQAEKFRIFEHIGEDAREVCLADDRIENITWTVHVANKKPIWYTFSELQGNLEFGPENSYKNQHIQRNNPQVKGKKRKKMMIDPGPRSIDTPGDRMEFSRYNIPEDYPHGSFPPVGAGGSQIDTLGELRMDDAGNLVVLGPFGNVTGSSSIQSFQGAGGYWDDISDGYVTATIHFKDREPVDVEPAWLIVGSPKYAPELVNITTLHDTMYNVAIRYMEEDTNIFDEDLDTAKDFPSHQGYTPLNGYKIDYKVNFRTQVEPIIQRMAAYRWVADIPYLADFANPGFDLTDATDANRENRMRYFNYFRVPVKPQDYEEWIGKVKNGPNQLFSQDGIPLMPLNSGDNSVTNTGPIYKFETLTTTQYFFMHQWAIGNFYVEEPEPMPYCDQLDEASMGNCAGAPMSPGIETTWITRSAAIYDRPMHIRLANFDGGNGSMQEWYREHGLNMRRDEAEGDGCEPGDLTKRMAIPWQADFQQCIVQTPNISNISFNDYNYGLGIEVPPTYYVYWWPPQSPMHVVAGSMDPGDQVLDAIVSGVESPRVVAAGLRVPYQRGIVSIGDMVGNWSRLGFIVNQGPDNYPYFVETERDSLGLAQLVGLSEQARIAATQDL